MLSARVSPAEFRYIKTGMRGIAAPAAAHFYFGKQLIGFFNNRNLQPRVKPGGIYSTEKTGCSPAYHNKLFRHTTKME
jgi:hypothetical protein